MSLRRARFYFLRIVRIVSLAILAMIGTILLVRFAPGYFTDSREMDAQYGAVARAQLTAQQQQEGTTGAVVRSELHAWMHGDLGRSRQYGVPVRELVHERMRTTARLLLLGVLCGWLSALALALPASAVRTRAGEALLAMPSALLLATPVAAMATACLLADFGGPLLVLSLAIGVRDYQFVRRLLRQALRAPHFLYARAQGLSTTRLLRTHVLPYLLPELLAVAMTSFVLALSSVVPVEVIFDTPGLGQLAWSAAMNRDLPVLLAITLLMAGCVGFAGLFVDLQRTAEIAQCA